MLNTVFEKETCTRCGGTGQYSYNQVDGSRCYGCGGKGEKLTKRGAVASKFYTASLIIGRDELKVGDVIRQEQTNVFARTVIRYNATVTEIDPNHRNGFAVKTHSPKHGEHGSYGFRSFARVPTAEQREKLIAAALEYQANLTKTGTPRKRG